MSSRQNNGYLLPDPLTGYELVCLQMQIPNTRLYRAAIYGAITELTKWWNWERTGDNSGSIAAQYWRQLILETLTIDGCTPDDLPPISPASESFGGGSIDQFLQLLQELDVKYRIDGQLYEPVIDLVPCGCGDEDGESSSAVAPVPGASGGADYGGFTTLCDALGVLPDYIIDSVDDMIGRIATGNFVVDFLTKDVIPIFDNIEDSLGPVAAEINDPDFRIILENNIIKYFSDPWVPVERGAYNNPFKANTLFNFAMRFPPVFEGAPMWAAFIVWAAQTNMNEFNKTVADAAGTGNYETTCEQAFSRVGRTPFDPSSLQPDLNDVFVTDGSLGTYTTRIFPMGVPYDRYTISPAIPPYDATGQNLVGSGIVITDIDNIAGNAPQPTMRYNDGAVPWWASTNNLSGILQYHISQFHPMSIIAADREEISQRVTTRVGVPIDDEIFQGAVEPTDPDLWVGAADIDTGSATVAYIWVVEFVPA